MSREKRLVPLLKNNGMPMKANKVERNALCKCGSGKKAKKCCGVETQYLSRQF